MKIDKFTLDYIGTGTPALKTSAAAFIPNTIANDEVIKETAENTAPTVEVSAAPIPSNNLSISKEELELLKQESFRRGFDQAKIEASNELKQKETLEKLLLVNLERKFDEIYAKIQQNTENDKSSITDIAYEIAIKIATYSLDVNFKQEVLGMLNNIIPTIVNDKKITLYLNTEIVDSILNSEEMKAIISGKNIELKPEPTIEKYDLKIDWEGGGIIVNKEKLIEKITEELGKKIASKLHL